MRDTCNYVKQCVLEYIYIHNSAIDVCKIVYSYTQIVWLLCSIQLWGYVGPFKAWHFYTNELCLEMMCIQGAGLRHAASLGEEDPRRLAHQVCSLCNVFPSPSTCHISTTSQHHHPNRLRQSCWGEQDQMPAIIYTQEWTQQLCNVVYTQKMFTYSKNYTHVATKLFYQCKKSRSFITACSGLTGASYVTFQLVCSWLMATRGQILSWSAKRLSCAPYVKCSTDWRVFLTTAAA